MKYLVLMLTLLATCSCDVEFSERPRNFSIELIHFTQLQTGGHVVISPFGIWTLLTGVALGATGDSYSELRRAFIMPQEESVLINGYKNLTKSVLQPTSDMVTLTSKNFLFLANDFQIKRNFQNVITNQFGAEIKLLNFNDPDKAAQLANNEILQKSGGKVSNVLTSDDFAQSRMILSNVISFKGLWSSRFNTTETTEQPFYSEDRQILGNVNMMYQRKEFPFSNIQNLKAFALELPYGNDGKYSMLFLLPYPKGKVADCYRRLESVSLREIFTKLNEDVVEYGLEEVDVLIPRFRISTNVAMNKPLNDMGVYQIFEPDSANFSKISDEKIFVSAIIHKAEIEVTESGTVASAVTSALFADRKTTTMFQANKPFIYFVIEKPTMSVIFGGIYSKPSLY